ncbi:hypothetical protein [Vibrio sp. WXL210]|uniref:hypothetical protein n=1 Tax=Vibrio sp. WXL210 TaxID=3450709 RepID=UPI003EC56D47
MKVNIHFGVHKTATTYLQGQLKQSQVKLLDNSVEYVDFPNNRKKLTSKFFGLVPTLKREDIVDGVQVDNIIISEENLIGGVDTPLSGTLYPNLKSNVERMLSIFRHDTVRVFITIRSFDGFLASLYCEYLRHYKFLSFDEYIQKMDLENLSWFECFKGLIKANPDVEFVVFDFSNFRIRKSMFLEQLSFGCLGEFSPSIPVSRSSITHEAISFLSKFPERSRDVLRKMEASGYIFGEKYMPFDDEQRALFSTRLENDIKMLSKLDNVSVI